MAPSGAKMNCPSEPDAVAMPKAQLRRSGGTMRPRAAMTIEKDEKAMPMPTSRPPARLNITGVAAKAISSTPRA